MGSNDEATARSEISEAMIAAGVMAFVDWKQRRKTDDGLSRADLVSAIYVAMRRAAKKAGGE